MSFEGKNLYGQYIDYSEEKKWPKGFICPYTGTIFYNIRIYSRSQVSVYRTVGPLVSSSEYIGCQCSGVHPLAGNESLYKWSRSHDQDGHHGYK